jgi:hypothetical protein
MHRVRCVHEERRGRLSIAFLLLLASQVSLLPNHNAGWFVSSREQAAFQFSLHSRRLSPFSPFTAGYWGEDGHINTSAVGIYYHYHRIISLLLSLVSGILLVSLALLLLLTAHTRRPTLRP